MVNKKVAKKKVAKKKVARASRGGRMTAALMGAKKIPGYVRNTDGLYVPEKLASVVSPSKLRKGFARAKTEISDLVEDIVETMTEDYVISEIELNASFSADGKFMGIGVGGAASIKIKIAPDRGLRPTTPSTPLK